MVKVLRFLVVVLCGAWAVGGGSGCGADKPAAIVSGTGGNGSGGATPSGSGGAAGQAAASGLQFNGSITFVRGQR
jgi:hypothetical protein